MKSMKFFGLMLSFALVMTGTFMLSGCNASSFDADKLTFNDTFVYDGNKHILEVSYEELDLNVTYSTTADGEFKSANEFNFTDADTYELYFKVSADGYLDYTSSEAVSFEITQKDVTVNVNNVVKLVEDKANQDYAQIAPTTNASDVVVAGDDLNLSFTIGNKSGTQTAFVAGNVVAGEKYNIVATYDNDNYDVTFNNGFVEIKDNVEVAKASGEKVYYSTLDNSIYSDIDKGSVISIYKDFKYASETAAAVDVRLYADQSTDDYEFVIDLNGHTVEYRFTFTNWINATSTYTGGTIVATIKNGSIGKTSITGYGLTVFGNDKVDVTMEDLTISGESYGFSSNGYCEGATVTAEDCDFIGIGAGLYAPGKYEYSFENCTFTGATGYYAKSGDHTLTNCDFIGNQTDYVEPTYNGSGSHSTGSAIVIDSAQGYLVPMNVTLTGCSFDSVSGYCIEEFSTSKTGDQNTLETEIVVSDANYIRTGKTKAVFSENYPTDNEILQGVHPNNLVVPEQQA